MADKWLSDTGILNFLSSKATAFISYINREEKFIYLNQKYEEIFNRPIHEVVGHNLRDMIGEQGYTCCKPFINRVLGGEEVTFEYPWEYKKDNYRYLKINYVPNILADGSISGFYSFIDDAMSANGLSRFSETPDINEFLPNIVGERINYKSSLFIEALNITQEIIKIATNIYYEGFKEEKINQKYAYSIIKIIIRSNALKCT